MWPKQATLADRSLSVARLSGILVRLAQENIRLAAGAAFTSRVRISSGYI